MSFMNVMNVMNVLQRHQGGKLNFYPCIPLGNVHDVHTFMEPIFEAISRVGSRFDVNFCYKSVRGGGDTTE